MNKGTFIQVKKEEIWKMISDAIYKEYGIGIKFTLIRLCMDGVRHGTTTGYSFEVEVDE